MTDLFVILPAEYLGAAKVEGGILDIGGVKVPYPTREAHVYVRRQADTGEVVEIALARHDGLAQESLSHPTATAKEEPHGRQT